MLSSLSQGRVRSRYFELIAILTLRNLKVWYHGSVLGMYWSLLKPLVMTTVYTGIFSLTFLRYYQGSALRYALAVFIGLVAVNFFSVSTSQALTSIVSNGTLLNKIKLPASIFPLSVVAAQSLQLVVVNLPPLALLAVLIGHNPSHILILLAPIAALIGLSTGVALFVSTAYVFFRDVPYFYELVTFLIWLTSPVFYPVAIVPEQLRMALWVNPLFPIMESMRQICLNYGTPDLRLIGIALLEAAVAYSLGRLAFEVNRRKFMDFV